MKPKYKVESYSRNPMPLLGHITYSYETDDLKKAKDYAHEQSRSGNINIWIYKDGKQYMQVAHKL